MCPDPSPRLPDDATWPAPARRLLAARYLRRDEQGVVTETIAGLFERVAIAVAAAEGVVPNGADATELAERFYAVMIGRRFLPNSPTLINAGTELGQLLACFVLPVPDSLNGIFTALHDTAIIQQSGGGTGFAFSALRPRGDLVRSTRRPSSGPVSFLPLFDLTSKVIAGESVRGGANMGVLRADHPDIKAFVAAKRDPAALTNFNLSVAVPDAFLAAAQAGSTWPLVNPRDGQVVATIRADELLAEIADNAWATGDPGLLFLDRIARDNPTPALGQLEATNPCGEVPLLPYEACCLGSLNLAAFVVERDGRARLDEAGLAATASLAMRFLDNVVEVTRYPLPAIAARCRANRKVGLGIMGLADLLLALGIPYGSAASVQVAARAMGLVQQAAVEASRQLAVERGAFPNFAQSRYVSAGAPPRRNATVTTVAPTGSISLLAGCSSGIEPLYALAHEEAGDLFAPPGVHPRLLRALEQHGLADPPVLRAIEASGRIGQLSALPPALRQLFRTATEIPPHEHLAIQAAVQRHVENAVSKTINLPAGATAADVQAAYREAHRLGCKGITVYREGTRPGQVRQLLGHCLTCAGEDRLPVAAGVVT
jgi:ribonucleoside-diphosphate reductase alpha chain